MDSYSPNFKERPASIDQWDASYQKSVRGLPSPWKSETFCRTLILQLLKTYSRMLCQKLITTTATRKKKKNVVKDSKDSQRLAKIEFKKPLLAINCFCLQFLKAC